MNADTRQALVEAVQANCDIADARHAGELTLCTYLLQLREFFRWQQGRPLGAALARAEVGNWIASREALWDRLQADTYRPLPIDERGPPVDPFDTVAINARLHDTGLLYGAGLADGARPVFFLAELHGRAQRDGLPVAVAGRELARGLLAPPAALADEYGAAQIVLRRESLARWGWERFEAFTLRPAADSAFAAAVRAYGLDGDLHAALPRFGDDQAEAALLHELGEYRVGQRLGPAWAALRQALPTRRGELLARALRDLLADVEVTLPTLLERGAEPSLHVWFAAFDGLREQLHPALREAYAAWRRGDGGAALRAACTAGRGHFERLAQRALECHAAGGADAGPAVEALLGADAAVCRG